MTDREEIEDLIRQIIGDYNTYENMGHTTEQSIESTVAYDLPNIEALLVQARKQVVEEVLGIIDASEKETSWAQEAYFLGRNELRATLREEIGKLGASEVTP